MDNYKEYSKALPLSAEVYKKLFPAPKTHEEWAESFNKIGDINEIITKGIGQMEYKLNFKSGDESNK